MPLDSIVVGSDEHKELFCRSFVETHERYDPNAVHWPALDAEALERLQAMPFWDEAVGTERDVARKITRLAPCEPDPLLREAITLQGYEEARHAEMLEEMLHHYGIPLPRMASREPSGDPEWDFMRVGYGECFDSFFAFGLYKLARDSGLFPADLLDIMEPLVQEEARHILFFANWIAYRRARQPALGRAVHHARSAAAMAVQVWARFRVAKASKRGGSGKGGAGKTDDFMLSVKDALGVVKSPREFLAICLSENDRRLAQYDPRLVRPSFVPGIARALARIP